MKEKNNKILFLKGIRSFYLYKFAVGVSLIFSNIKLYKCTTHNKDEILAKYLNVEFK